METPWRPGPRSMRSEMRAHLVADLDDVALLVRGEGNVVQAGAVAAGRCGVVHGALAVHPGGVGGALVVLDVPGTRSSARGTCGRGGRPGSLVEVIQADQPAGRVQVVTHVQALNVLGLEEELVGEAQRILDAMASKDALDEALGAAPGAAAHLLVVRLGDVDVLGVRTRKAMAFRAATGSLVRTIEVVVDELLEGAQVDLVLVLG